MYIQSRSTSSTTTHFTKSFPKRADITGSPKQGFHMLDTHDKYVCVFLASGYGWVTVMHEIPISSAQPLTSLPYPRTQ